MSRLVIFLVFLGFYGWNSLMTWGMFELGIWHATDYTTFSVVIFAVTLICLVIMIILGSISNKKAHLADFLNTKISEKKSQKEEEETRKKQEDEYAERMAERQAAQDAQDAQAAQEAQNVEAGIQI
jgi:FtsZ-interacting cell division protein ZipA